MLKISVFSFTPIELTVEPFVTLLNLFEDFLNTKSSPLKLRANCVFSKLSGNEAVLSSALSISVISPFEFNS